MKEYLVAKPMLCLVFFLSFEVFCRLYTINKVFFSRHLSIATHHEHSHKVVNNFGFYSNFDIHSTISKFTYKYYIHEDKVHVHGWQLSHSNMWHKTIDISIMEYSICMSCTYTMHPFTLHTPNPQNYTTFVDISPKPPLDSKLSTRKEVSWKTTRKRMSQD